MALMPLFCACNPAAELPESTAAMPKEAKPKARASDTVILNSESASLANIKTIIAEERTVAPELKSTGEIKADEGRVFHINSIVSGRVIKDNVSLGQFIKEGQQLAIVQNLEVSRLYGQYIHEMHQNEINIQQSTERLDLCKKNLDRARILFNEGIGAQKEVIAAENQYKLTDIELKGYREHAIHIKSEAEALLSAYGIKLSQTADSHKVETGSPLTAPRAGVIIAKNITMGDVVTAEQPLYVVADLSKVWLDVTVYDKDLASINIGEKVIFRSDSIPNKVFDGSISYIPPSASNMRTFIARAVLPNPGLLLKPGMFGQVLIQKSERKRLPYLPDGAIQKYANETFAFVELGDGHYQKRVLKLSTRIGDGYLVESGISTGERVVKEGSFKLKSELLKSTAAQED